MSNEGGNHGPCGLDARALSTLTLREARLTTHVSKGSDLDRLVLARRGFPEQTFVSARSASVPVTHPPWDRIALSWSIRP